MQTALAQYEEYQKSCKEEAIRLATKFRRHPTHLRSDAPPGPSPSVALSCTMGCGHRSSYTVLDRYPMCFDCATSVMITVVMQEHANIFKANDATVLESIRRIEDPSFVSPVTSPVRSRQATETAEGDTWACQHCTFQNSAFNRSCEVCSIARPEIICPRCLLDALSNKVCKATRDVHEFWNCAQCSTVNLSEQVECRACHGKRPWYCKACTFENEPDAEACAVCGGTARLDNVRSLVRLTELETMGLSAAEAENERQTSTLIEAHSERLERRLADAEVFDPIPISDDGNCLFRALAYQLWRNEQYHALVRAIVVNYLNEERATYSAYVGESEFPNYVNNMAKDGTWGDELCIQAAAMAFQTTIHVITSEEVRWHLRYKIYGEADPAPGRHIFLAYVSPVHYYCFTLKNDVSLPQLDLDAIFKRLAPNVTPEGAGSRRVSAAEESVRTTTGGVSPGSVMRVLRPASAVSRQHDWLPASRIPNLRHAVVVAVRLGDSNQYLTSPHRIVQKGPPIPTGPATQQQGDQPMMTISVIASRFYLHPAGIDPQTKGPKFFLQCAASGALLRPAETLVSPKSRVPAYPIVLDQLSSQNIADVDDFAISIQGKGEFVFPAKNLPWHCTTDRRVVATTDKVPGTTLRLVVMFEGKKERNCKACRSWYTESDGDTAKPQKCPSGGSHRNVCQFAEEMLAK